jgi:hypothetical protein
VAAPKILPPKILPRPEGRGCAKNPADRKYTLSSRFAFHIVSHLEMMELWSIFPPSYA